MIKRCRRCDRMVLPNDTTTSVSQPDLAGKQVGDSLDLIVDSRNPRRLAAGSGTSRSNGIGLNSRACRE
ncbi:hypothetical protein [Haloferula sp. BvORR071]|uniref:hypothetical protein n=1 Tax=Haloferula sp. BvORR071 TaxID=1396141 RepID=UPI000556E9FC|nr:hypothetical protein [Haloferula sp. BvORR071]